MKYILLLLIASSLLSCQKENEVPESLFTAYDSLVGDWNFDHEYLLISLVSNPTVITDSDYIASYAPHSYFRINADSTYRWWRTEMPPVGYGVSGKIVAVNDSLRYLRISHVNHTSDNFTTEIGLNPVNIQQLKIKALTNNQLVTIFTVPQNDGRLFHWHEVYVR